MAIATTEHKKAMPLSASTSDVYQLVDALTPDELAVVKKGLTYMERKVQPIINKYWSSDALASRRDSRYQHGLSAQPSRSRDTLTARERDILGMISQGLPNKRIARALEISPETVKSHVKQIFLKLAVSTRAEAVSRALSLVVSCRWESAILRETSKAKMLPTSFESIAVIRCE